MGETSPRSIVLDAGALIALERGDRRVLFLLRDARAGRERIIVPAGVLAQVWRDGARQVRLASLIGDSRTEIEPLDEVVAKAAGALCGLSGTSDIVEASVVLAATAARPSIVLTSGESDLRRIDPKVRLLSV